MDDPKKRIFQSILFFSTYISYHLCTDQNKINGNTSFPAHLFFNTSQSYADLSKYLCQIRPNEEKCCGCDPNLWNYNWCIDIYWDGDIYSDLDIYLRYLVKESKWAKTERQCLPLLTTTKHITQHLKMFPNHRVGQNDLSETVTVPVLHINPSNDHKEIFASRMIAEYYDIYNYVFSNISVRCKDAENLKLDNIFTLNQFNDMNECILTLDTSGFGELYSQFCPFENQQCTKENKYYDLCNAYYAPYRGYRNFHCYKCANDVNGEFPVDACKYKCRGNRCSLPLILQLNEEYPISFRLVAENIKNDVKWVVKDIYNYFPITKFFHFLLGDSRVPIS